MSTSLNRNEYPTSANEPKMHPAIRRGFAFVPTVGMRLAPEIMLIELFREIFPREHCESTSERSLDPELTEDGKPYYSSEERAVLYALRGRRRKSKSAKVQHFYAPAYAQLTRNTWLRRKSDRVINRLFFGGALANYLWHAGNSDEAKARQEELVEIALAAMVGRHTCQDDDVSGKEILSVALKNVEIPFDIVTAKENLMEKTSGDSIIRLASDPLSFRIANDFTALCELEKILPRMQWLKVLMTFLRFSLPMWLLSHMRITSMLHAWLIEALDHNRVVSVDSILSCLRDRYVGLLQPTLTPTRQIFEHTERYVKHRVELNILLYNFEWNGAPELSDKRMDTSQIGAEYITVEELMDVVRRGSPAVKNSERFVRSGAKTFSEFLTREGETFHAWRDPLNKGQGKNIDEFFRVMYRDDVGDEAGGYLLIPSGRAKSRGFRLFPGQHLLKTVVFLAARDKKIAGSHKGGGQLVLGDVEDHFRQYGIDFHNAADARPLLMEELQSLGLLTGSPDAGASVTVSNPY